MDYKTHIAGIFDRSASDYGSFGTHYFEIFAERLINHVMGFEGAKVLDVATGRGAILKRVLPLIGNQGKAVGIDLSPKMIEAVRQELKADNVSVHCMDAESIDFESESFDLVYCGFALFFFPDVKKALREFKRVLKPKGKIAVSTWGEIGKTRRVLKQRLASFGIDPVVTAHPMPSAKELEALFIDAGFSSVNVTADNLDHRYLNFDHWMQCLWRHATRSSLEQLNEAQLEVLRDQLCEELDSENRPDGFHEEFNVFYTTASITPSNN